MIQIRTPAELQADEAFRAELRQALDSPVIQVALGSLRFHRGLFRGANASTPSTVIHQHALWTSGFNAAIDNLEDMTRPPKPKAVHREPFEHIVAEDT